MKIFDFENCFVTDWGIKAIGGYSDILKKRKVSVITNQNCQNNLRSQISNEFILDRSFICGVEEFSNDTICVVKNLFFL